MLVWYYRVFNDLVDKVCLKRNNKSTINQTIMRNDESEYTFEYTQNQVTKNTKIQ